MIMAGVEPNMQRTYTVTPNIVVAQQASLIATNRRLLRLMVQGLIDVGATCLYSCDGVTAGAVGDGVNRWDSDADIVFGSGGVAKSWIVLDLGAGFLNVELLVVATAASANGDISAELNVSGWTSGTVTSPPSAVSGTPITLTYGSAMPVSVNYAAHIHVIKATDGTSWRVIAVDDTADSVICLLLLETHYDGPAAFPYPIGGTWYSYDNLSDLSVSANIWHSWSTSASTPTNSNLAALATGGEITYGGYGTVLDEDNLLLLYPCAGNDTSVGWLGYIPDLWWAMSDPITFHKTIPATGRRWACFGSIVVPWDGTTDLGGGSTDAHAVMLHAGQEPATAPSFTGATPTSGAALTSTTTQVAFTVTNPDEVPFAIWLKFVSEARAFLAYDSLDGLKYPFTGTVDATDPTAVAISLVQIGGWQDDIEDIRLGGVA